MTLTFDQFCSAIQTAPNDAFTTTVTEDWGTLRGQGRRFGGGVVGGMRDASLQGEKTYRLQVGLLPDAERADLATFQPHQLTAYCQTRAVGFGHDVAFLAGVSYPALADAYLLYSQAA